MTIQIFKEVSILTMPGSFVFSFDLAFMHTLVKMPGKPKIQILSKFFFIKNEEFIFHQ